MGLLQVSAIDKRGELSTIYTNEQFADGWTHILKGNFFGAVNTSDGREPKKCGKRHVKGCYLPETNGLPLLRPF